jgi:hypothetical protein
MYNNNYFGYKFNGITYTINLLDGYYDMNDLNAQLQNAFYTNGHYRVQSNGDYFYPAQLQYNPNLYAIQLNTFVITSTLPSGWTNRANFNVVADTSVQLYIPDTNIKNVFGYNAGYYPPNPSSTIYSKISDFTPIGSPLNSIIMKCNLVDNKLCIPSDILYAITPNVSLWAKSDCSISRICVGKLQKRKFFNFRDRIC